MNNRDPQNQKASEAKRRVLGIIGVGNMGGAIANNLLAKGWTLWVHDIDEAKTKALQARGALVARDPLEMLAHCQDIIICVVDAEQVGVIVRAMCSAQPSGSSKPLGPGHTVFLCPTTAPSDVERFAREMALCGAGVVDAPMSGGPARALEGRMSLMVACTNTLYRESQALLKAIAEPVFYISEQVGDAAKTKLVNNLLAAINLIASAEVIALAEKVGLDLQTTLNVIESSSGQSWVGSDRMRRAIGQDPRTLTPTAHMTLLEKDTRLALEMSGSLGYAGPLGAAAARTFKQASASGLAHCDDAAILEFLRHYKQ